MFWTWVPLDLVEMTSSSFLGPTVRIFILYFLPFEKEFRTAQTKKNIFLLLLQIISFAHLSYSPWQLPGHSPAAWLRMTATRVQCLHATVSGEACIFHVVGIKSDKAFCNLFKKRFGDLFLYSSSFVMQLAWAQTLF